MARVVLLLRGVNVGGVTVRSVDLRALLADAGLGEVRTVLASGNAIVDATERHGEFDIFVKSQISFGRTRQFAWFWLYNITRKNPDGVPHLMLAIDHPVDSAHVRNVEQISRQRRSHQIVIRSVDDANSEWLAELIGLARHYGAGCRSRILKSCSRADPRRRIAAEELDQGSPCIASSMPGRGSRGAVLPFLADLVNCRR